MLPARIDTGASLTSLDARNIRIDDGYAEFEYPSSYGGQHLRLRPPKSQAKKYALLPSAKIDPSFT